LSVTGRGKNAIEDHFDSAGAGRFSDEKGKSILLKLVHDIWQHGATSEYAQEGNRWPWKTVLVAKELVGNEPFAVCRVT